MLKIRQFFCRHDWWVDHADGTRVFSRPDGTEENQIRMVSVCPRCRKTKTFWSKNPKT